MKDFDSYDWSAITYPLNYARSIFEFARVHQFKNGLEVGFDQGASALAFLRACPEGKLFSIDIGDCSEKLEVLKNRDVGVDRFTFQQADSRIFLCEWFQRQQASDKFDYIYIDGDHLYDAVRQDLFNAGNLLADDGCMMVDDCDPNHTHFGVYQAVEEFKAECGFVSQPLLGSTSSAVVLTKILHEQN